MIPGPDYIYKCPTCEKLFKQGSLTSGNTFGAKLFSDGKNVAPMLPSFPIFTKCENCNSILYIRELKEVAIFDYNHKSGFTERQTKLENDKNGDKSTNWFKSIFSKQNKLDESPLKVEYQDIKHCHFLGINDLYRALEFYPQYEATIRQEIWWTDNDLFRLKLDQNFPIGKECDIGTRYEENCLALLKLLDKKDENQKIMMAELYRNLGQFDKCTELIRGLPENRYSDLKWIFESECKKGNQLTFCIDFEKIKKIREAEERKILGETEWLLRQQQKEQERLRIANAKKNIATLWKNGVAQSLTDEKSEKSCACSVYVFGNDVYVAGYEKIRRTDGQLKSTAVLWKNGVKQMLTDGSSYAMAYSVFVSNNDVYVVGEDLCYNSGNKLNNSAMLWKNGQLQILNGGTKANSVFVNKNDVYVVGEDWNNGVNAILWKNGKPLKLDRKKELAVAKSIYLVGDDVYIVGEEYNRNEACDAVLWKNSVYQNHIKENDTYAQSVFVIENDIYIAGFMFGSRTSILWKNGEPQKLGDREAKAFSVYISGNDVYVAGQEGAYHNSVAVLWKNGVQQELTDGNHKAEAHSVFVSGNDVYVAGIGYEYEN